MNSKKKTQQIDREHKEKAKEMLLTIGVDFPKANTFISFDDSIAYTELSVSNK